MRTELVEQRGVLSAMVDHTHNMILYSAARQRQVLPPVLPPCVVTLDVLATSQEPVMPAVYLTAGGQATQSAPAF